MSKQESSASMSKKGVSIEHKRLKVSGKVFSFAKYLLSMIDRVSLTYLWQSEETLMINSLDHKSFPSMTNWGCCLDNGEGVDYKIPKRQIRIEIDVRLEQIGMGLKPNSRKAIFPTKWWTVSKNWVSEFSHSDLTDPVWRWLDTFSWLPIPVTVSFLSCHALLTENKDSVNGTGIGFMVWGKALKFIKHHIVSQTLLN